jgi:two-component system, NarL family, response regulator
MKDVSANNNHVITLLLADDHPVTREGLALILSTEEDMVVVAQAGDGNEAVALYRKHLPGVVVLDLQMPGLNGFGAAKQILAEFPQANILLFTTYDGDEDIHRAMHAGARGYLVKDAPQEELCRAIRMVHRGGRYLSPSVGAKLADTRTASPLTDREREILKLMAEGKANKEISFVVGISESTVKTHVAAVIEKLGVNSRTEAALVAQKRGFLRD